MISTAISSSVLIVTVIILRMIFRSKISSQVQYAIWGLVLIHLLLPFPLYSSQISIMNVLKTSDVVDTISWQIADATEGGNNIKKEYNQVASENTSENNSNQSTLNHISQGKLSLPRKELPEVAMITWICGMFLLEYGCLLRIFNSI